jgi:hypothetical protein
LGLYFCAAGPNLFDSKDLVGTETEEVRQERTQYAQLQQTLNKVIADPAEFPEGERDRIESIMKPIREREAVRLQISTAAQKAFAPIQKTRLQIITNLADHYWKIERPGTTMPDDRKNSSQTGSGDADLHDQASRFLNMTEPEIIIDMLKNNQMKGRKVIQAATEKFTVDQVQQNPGIIPYLSKTDKKRLTAAGWEDPNPSPRRPSLVERLASSLSGRPSLLRGISGPGWMGAKSASAASGTIYNGETISARQGFAVNGRRGNSASRTRSGSSSIGSDGDEAAKVGGKGRSSSSPAAKILKSLMRTKKCG